MQYNFLGFSVSKMMELNLDMKDIAILRYFVDFKETGRMNYEIVEGEKYYWINYSTLEMEMPYLGLGKRAIMLRMLKLRDLGILVHYTKKEGGTYSFYNLGDKYNELINNNISININNNINKGKVAKNKDESNIYENEYKYKRKYEEKYENQFDEEEGSLLEINEEDRQEKNRQEEENRQEKKDKQCRGKEEEKKQEKNIQEENRQEDSVQEKEQYLHGIPNYVQNYAQGVHGNERSLCTNMFKGCVSKDRTKTPLLNNSSTKETNIKKYIKKEVEEIVEYLNKELGTNYKTTFKSTIKLIDARLTEGFTVYDFKTVIDKKAKEWTGTEYEKYLTPTTLFGDKFEKYLNQKVVIVSEKTRYKNNYDAPKLRFNNFTGREYDYDELEKKLLGW